jgi:23S rRNA pseudouridine2605 synthase
MTIIPESERNEQRLQKIVAVAGIASRRKAEELITSGRVQVNGQTVSELGSKADPERDHIRVDGKLLKKPQQFRYFMLNKPKGVVTTVSDPEGRPTVMKFFARAGARVFPVGRLDYQSEGLLLMTNDGELANVLTSAASQVEKTYLVKVSGKPTEGELEQLRRGVMIERGRRGEREGRVMTQPAKISLVRDTDNPWYEVVLTEGKNREIRKMFEEVGHFVEKVRRVGFGPLVLDVPPGETRELSEDEVTQLKKASRRRVTSSEHPREQPRRRPRSGPAALPRPVRKRIKTRSSPSNK